MVVVMLAASTFGACIAKEYSNISPSLLMVGVMYIIQLSGLFQWCVRQSAEVENMMISVERILAYTRLPSEPALHGPVDLGSIQRTSWPEEGTIVANNLVCSYRTDLPPVIRGINFTILSGERVGIVGR
jgi:ATP-binding cassette subfamily C (CFTR/MRP) protein 4